MSIQVAGIERVSFVDYPGRVSTVFFLQGCPLRCVYCHNKSMLDFRSGKTYTPEMIIDELKSNKLIDSVVFSGGEATWQYKQLLNVVEQIQTHLPQLKIGLHTSGVNANALRSLLTEIDFVGLDIKGGSEEVCSRITGNAMYSMRQVIQDVQQSGVVCEYRTTAHTDFISVEEMCEIEKFLCDNDVRCLVVQRYNVDGKPKEHPKQLYGTHLGKYIEIRYR